MKLPAINDLFTVVRVAENFIFWFKWVQGKYEGKNHQSAPRLILSCRPTQWISNGNLLPA